MMEGDKKIDKFYHHLTILSLLKNKFHPINVSKVSMTLFRKSIDNQNIWRCKKI